MSFSRVARQYLPLSSRATSRSTQSFALRKLREVRLVLRSSLPSSTRLKSGLSSATISCRVLPQRALTSSWYNAPSVKLPDGRQLPSRHTLATMKAGGASKATTSTEALMLEYLDGHDTLKPLDCVGSIDEARLAMWLAERRHAKWATKMVATAKGGSSGGSMRPPSYFGSAAWRVVREGLEQGRQGEAEGGGALGLLHEWNSEHLIPAWLEPTVRQLWDARTRPE